MARDVRARPEGDAIERHVPRRAGHARSAAAPDWYKDAVIYEVHVRAFRDSDGDGIGDFRGLIEKLDYLVDLGVTALWLLPFYPSPGRDDGYDISDYTSVHPDYGTLADVRALLAEAHRRGLRVISELVLNHTSDQHHWFQRARRAPAGSPWREYYVWSDTDARYAGARIIFRDFETSNWTWDPVAGAYYWHRFYSHQPDLNYEDPRVRQEILATVDFWLDLGFDGLRLDAVPYLYEAEGTDCENLPATHAFLRDLRRHVDERYGDRMLLAEANQWPEEAVAYFGSGTGDECHMAFHFPLMPRIFMALRTEDRFPIIDILEQTPPIPASSQWAIFLRNHDELTLEMVTDEERDYLYRAYASDPAARINLGIRRRLAPLAGTRRKLELLYGLLFSLPGTPVLYYGDEIGMGDNYFLGDRDAVRTPMQWSPDRNAGFSEANRQRLYLPLIVDPEYHFEAVNVAAQEGNPSSLLWWMKRVIGLRRRHPALARGRFEVVPTPNRQILAYLREHDGETILAIANLSRYAQWCELDLRERAGWRVMELFGGAAFPPVGPHPYALTLGPHSFLWFRLEAPGDGPDGPPIVEAAEDGSLVTLLEGASRRGNALAVALARWLAADPGYREAEVILASARIASVAPIAVPGRQLALAFVQGTSRSGEGVTAPLVVELLDPTRAARRRQDQGEAIARIRRSAQAADAVLADASADPEVARVLAGSNGGSRPSPRGIGLRLRPVGRSRRDRGEIDQRDATRPPAVRLVGRVEPAPLPEAVVAEALMAAGAPVEPIRASIEAVVDGRPAVVGVVVSAGDASRPTFRDEAAASLDRLLETALAEPAAPRPIPLVGASVLAIGTSADERDDAVARGAGEAIEIARGAGACLAAIHDALARPGGLAPLPYGSMDRRALYQEVRGLLAEVIAGLGAPGRSQGSTTAELEAELMRVRPALEARLRTLIDRHFDGLRIPRFGGPITGERVVREAGRYVVAIPVRDFRPSVDRTRMRTPLLDVAALLVSLRSIALRPAGGDEGEGHGHVRPEDAARAEAWARAWWARLGEALLGGYLEALSRSALLPSATDDRALLLDTLMIELTLERLLADLRADRPADRADLLALLDLAGADPSPSIRP